MQDQELLWKLSFSGRAIQIISPATVWYRSHEANSYKNVPGLIADAYKLIARYKEGAVRSARRENYLAGILVGGPVFFVVKRANEAGLHWEALKLFVRGWNSIAIASLARLRAMLFGRLTSQILELTGLNYSTLQSKGPSMERAASASVGAGHVRGSGSR